MSIYAIADLHLSMAPSVDKPMDIYGARWYNHAERLKEKWLGMIKSSDTVIIAGDISWALKLEDAKYDLDWIDDLPGKKVIFKGNHDLWWNGINKLNKMYDNTSFVQNDFYYAEDIYICGTRGWITPDSDDYTKADEKVYRRELLRLKASLDKARAHMKAAGQEGEILGVLHYPPVSKPASFSSFQQTFEDYGVKHVLYGHIHGEDGFKNTIKGRHHGIEYSLISLDYLNCVPVCVKE